MHDCQKLREEVTDLVLGGVAIDPAGEISIELNGCTECIHFYRDACTVVNILDVAEPPVPVHSNEYWSDFSDSLQTNLMPIAQKSIVVPFHRSGERFQAFMLAAAAAVLVALSVLIFQSMNPLTDRKTSTAAIPDRHDTYVVDENIAGLDMGTVDYLGESELFLRTFVKISPNDVLDLEDARKRAQKQLVDINQRKEAAADFTPVVGVLDDYETILRDINNLEETTPADVLEIQERIEKNGLIANMKAYQPRVVLEE